MSTSDSEKRKGNAADSSQTRASTRTRHALTEGQKSPVCSSSRDTNKRKKEESSTSSRNNSNSSRGSPRMSPRRPSRFNDSPSKTPPKKVVSSNPIRFSPRRTSRHNVDSPSKTPPKKVACSNPTRFSPRGPSRSGSPTKTPPNKVTSSSPSRLNPRRRSSNNSPNKTPPKKVVSRKVKRVVINPCLNETDGRKGYTSDGMSFESVPDDELPDINVTSPYKGKQYSKDDIVWAPLVTKVVNMKWPAVVTSVQGPRVRFLYINSYDKPVRAAHAKRLVPFDNSSKNLELKELGDKVQGFKEAYELVIKYYCNRKQNRSLDARRFLTHPCDENDRVGLAKNCLFRLTGKSDSHTEYSEEIEEAEEVEIVSDEEMDEENGEEEPKLICPQAERVKEILEDLETLPRHMTVSSERHAKMKSEAEKLLGFIQSKDCFDHLMEIREGNRSSSRHTRYKNGERVQGALGPFTLFNDLTEQCLSTLDHHCDNYDSHDYKHNVMLPEAIIYAITQLKNCSKLDAKQYFNKTCNKLGIRD